MSQEFALGTWLNAMRQLEGWSYRDVAAQAARHGHNVSASGVERIEKTQPLQVRAEQIAWIADVFHVPPAAVARAFLQAMGCPLPDSPTVTVEDAIEADALLGQRDKLLLSALLAEMRTTGRPYRVDGGSV